MEMKHIIELILYFFSRKTLFPHISHCKQKKSGNNILPEKNFLF